LSLKNIFSKPEYIDGIGNIYPIKLKYYDDFIECSHLLYISKNHFEPNNIPLLELLFYSVEQFNLSKEDLIKKLEKLFSLVINKPIIYQEYENYFWFQIIDLVKKKFGDLIVLSLSHRDENGNYYWLCQCDCGSPPKNILGDDLINGITNSCGCSKDINQNKDDIFDEKSIISNHNYDNIRNIIMKQNLLFEQKVYKTELMNKWAEKAMKAKQKNAPNISLEDIITTVSVGCGKLFSDLEEYSIYQLYSDFFRLRKIMEHDSSVHFLCAGATNLKLQDFAESLNLYHNPYDDLFVSADKLTGLNKAIGK